MVMKIKHLMFFVVVEIWRSLVLIHTYTIERRVIFNSKNYTWRDMPDGFMIPTSRCSSGSQAQSTQCSEMGANYNNDNCKCECETSKSTFGFYEDEWKCLENTKVHVHGGDCSIKLDHDGVTPGVLVVLPMSTPEETYFLSILNANQYSCDVDDYSYLMCNGTWGHLDADLFKSRFTVTVVRKRREADWWYLDYSTGQPSISAINGRLVRLKLKCTRLWRPRRTTTHCALFKVTGTLTCPLSPTPSSSMTFSTRRVVSTSTVTITSSTSTVTITSSSSSSVPALAPAPSSLLPSPSSTPLLSSSVPIPTPSLSSEKLEYFTKPSTIVHPSAASSTTEKPTSGNNARTNILGATTATVLHREEGARSDASNSDMIAGVVAGVSGLVIIVIAMTAVMRRRKKRNTDSKSTVIAENESYGRGVDNSLRFNNGSQDLPDEDEYSYAYNNVAPIVKTNKPENLENHNKPNLEPERSVANLVYGQTEGLNQMASPSYDEAPVYNTLEDAVYAKVDKTKKACPSNSSDAPIYNTVEEPEYAKLNRGQKAKLPVETQDESLYNVLERPSFKVLEGPLPEDAPVYDVLEGPESDEALVYRALEGQDPHAYGALDKPDNQGPPEENRGYDDMVYDSVGDVINDQGDIYQELNQSGQHDSDVYQALNYPGNTMHLNEIKQAHSNA